MIPILTLFLVLSISILVTRISTIALVRTGLSRETARFQALSAFSGSGFTTQETELVVNHPVRRRIILNLMLLGNAGIVTVLSTLVVTFVRKEESGGGVAVEVSLMIAGTMTLLALAKSSYVDRHLTRWIERMLERTTDLNLRDYESLLRVAGDYRLFEVAVNRGDWLTGRKLCESDLRGVGILVLGITRKDGTYLGAPDASDVIQAGDNLLVYGRLEDMKTFDISKGNNNDSPEEPAGAVDVDSIPSASKPHQESQKTSSGTSS